MERKYKVSSSCYERMCHPETCSCSTDYVIVSNKLVESCHTIRSEIIGSVESVEIGNYIIKLLEKYPKDFEESIQSGLVNVIKKLENHQK